MKREFLENLKIGDQPLGKEAIDAIMAENGRDIEAAKKPFADYESVKEQLKTAKEGLKAFEGVDVTKLQEQIAKLQKNLGDKETEYQAQLSDMAFGHLLDGAISGAKGRNPKAVKALLDLDVLRQSKNQEADIKAALEALKGENSYLFESAETPPPYAAGTGTTPVTGKYSPQEAAIRSAAGLKNE